MSTVPSGSIIASVIDTWRRFGIFDFILPFLLVFAIIYGVLERTKLFGDIGKSVNAIIAFTIAMVTTLTGWFISFLTGYLPWVSVISIVIVTALMLIAMFVGDFDELIKDNKLMKIGGVIVAVSVGIGLLSIGWPVISPALDGLGNVLSVMGLTVTDLWGIIFFVGFIVVLVVIGKGGSKSGSK
ncbi:MAG: hypothetical protein WC307_03920 [Candidatus Nanoarchaeia archaeon]|jgi:hypothetical protein